MLIYKLSIYLVIAISFTLTKMSHAVMLNLQVENQHDSAGKAYVNFVSNQKDFDDDTTAIENSDYAQIKEIDAHEKKEFTFDLEPGVYAIKVFVDLNNNGKLDKIPIIKKPTEPYGFSRNVRHAMRKPYFEETYFTLMPDGECHVLDKQGKAITLENPMHIIAKT